MTNELKPCPFCGNEAYLYSARGYAYVECSNRESCGVIPSTKRCRSSIKAINHWNRRPITHETPSSCNKSEEEDFGYEYALTCVRELKEKVQQLEKEKELWKRRGKESSEVGDAYLRTCIDLRSQIQSIQSQLDKAREALIAARREMQNQYHNKPRIGMEETCNIVDEALSSLTPSVDHSEDNLEKVPTAEQCLEWLAIHGKFVRKECNKEYHLYNVIDAESNSVGTDALGLIRCAMANEKKEAR